MHILSYLCPLAEQDHEDCNFLSMPRLDHCWTRHNDTGTGTPRYGWTLSLIGQMSSQYKRSEQRKSLITLHYVLAYAFCRKNFYITTKVQAMKSF